MLRAYAIAEQSSVTSLATTVSPLFFQIQLLSLSAGSSVSAAGVCGSRALIDGWVIWGLRVVTQAVCASSPVGTVTEVI